MTNSLKITLAQLDFLVGDIEGNAKKIIATIHKARATEQTDLIVFPELALTGYPPEDLLYRSDLYERINAVFPEICAQTTDVAIIVGYPAKTETGCYNRAAFIQHQKIVQTYDKQILPNYSVFDEKRYFDSGEAEACIIKLKDIKIALTICEDLWFPDPMAQAVKAGADLVISINASPFTKDKAEFRESVMNSRVQESDIPLLYLNSIGAQDELVFDGGSMVFDARGRLVQQAKFFEEELLTVNIETLLEEGHKTPIFTSVSDVAKVYQALVLGLRYYIEKNQFPRAILGLSGGIDSALTLAIAVDAIGKDRVQAIMMPSRYTAEISNLDAKQQAETMGVNCVTLEIEPIFNKFLETLQPVFHDLPSDVTEENLQARCRGTLLMAISNKMHAIVLATGNKSEMAVGYSTLYGDMVGGFCVLKDVFKTMVYRLAEYRNSISSVIPNRVITRAPSAELAPNQKDEDSLPPYPILDAILARYIERDETLQTIIDAGFDGAMVRRVAQMVDCSEYKRRQAAPGIRITERAFGKDRRYPITSGFRPYCDSLM